MSVPPLMLSWFPTAVPKGPAIGDPETISWDDFASIVFENRREDSIKDGTCFATARFRLEPDGRHVRRLKDNLLSRTAVALDVESNKATGELPPDLSTVVDTLAREGWASVLYTSHNHTREAPRYRLVLPLSEEIAAELPAVETLADRLGLAGVLDRSKVGAQSLFYLPSCPYGCIDDHEAKIVFGEPIEAEWLMESAFAALIDHEAEKERAAEAAHAAAEARRAAWIAAGHPDDSLIEKIRARLDLRDILLSHGYTERGGKYRHPNSQSGTYGLNIKTLGGIERLFSHNAGDPLYASNLPPWCGVTALDAFDATVILDYGGDRNRAMRELAQRFGLGPPQAQIVNVAGRRALAKLIFSMARRGAPQAQIEAAMESEGARLGFTTDQVLSVAWWCATREAA